MIYAEDVNFWQTGKKSPDAWIDLAKKQIENMGGKVRAEGFGQDDKGRAAFMIGFTAGEQSFKLIQPVLVTKTGNEKAARIQAATILYHYVKITSVRAVSVGIASAFFEHLVLPDGRIASQLPNPNMSLPDMFPRLLSAGGQ